MACAKKLISFDENFNAMGYHPAMPVNIDKCNGCELCAIVCPDIAIEVYKNDK